MERKLGRTFNESDDEEFFQEKDSMERLLEKFANVDQVLQNAALSAALMHYIFNKSQDYFSLLYYYTVQKYMRLNETKNSARNYNHINMEIYTTFIHPKSILQTYLKNNDLLIKIEENINSENCIVYFNKVSEFIVSEILTKYLAQFQESIRLGLESYSYVNKINDNLSRVNELSILSTQQKFIQNHFIRTQKSRCLPFQNQDVRITQILYDFQTQALMKALNTQYEYFIFSKKYSYIIKNPDIVVPIKTFLSCTTVKILGKQRIKGHCFIEDTLSKIGFCLVCEIIIWGPHPNCLYCRNCNKAIHKECKEIVKYCQIDTKRGKTNECVDSEGEKGKIMEGERILGQMTKDLSNIIDGSKLEIYVYEQCKNNDHNLLKESPILLENDLSKDKDKPKLPAKPSILKVQEWRSQYSLKNDKTRKTNLKYATSMTVDDEIRKGNFDVVTRSKSARSPSPQKNFKKENFKLHIRSSSEDSGLATSVEPLPITEIDDEMKVLETFEAESELLRFLRPCKKSCFKNEGDYKRLLVLLEFHHKTRFTRMTLKRFKFLLVDPWLRMGEYLELFECLSLPCIDKLYKLISSLVDVIDSCMGEDTYDQTVAEKILHWLSDDEDRNVQNWLQLSIDLCCTNILQAVKAGWMEHKQVSPKLNDLFSVEINRILVIEQLSSMKPLLFNLPMIAIKIVKDLKHFPYFMEEAKVWEQVGVKLSYLPQLIDERCMPLVQLINNGIITNSSLKYKRLKNNKEYNKAMEAYINNFPKTIFKNNFIDFQFVRISHLRESYLGEAKSIQSVVYVREVVDAAIICYENEMIILQKENDKFFLKQFKSLGQHKLFPMIPFYKVHVTKQLLKENKQFQHELTVLLISQALLIKILFKDEKSRDMWYEHVTKRSKIVLKESSIPDHSSNTSGSIASSNNFDFAEHHDLAELDPSSSKMNLILMSLNESVTHVNSSLEFVTHELSTDESRDLLFTRIKNNGPRSASEFMFVYMTILKKFASLGSQILEEKTMERSSVFLEREVITLKLPKLKEITEEMMTLISAQEDIDDSKSSDESTLENDHFNSLEEDTPDDINNYIENIILEALNKVQYDSK